MAASERLAVSDPVARRGPRTQAERRAETRTALLEATIECLAAYGYAGTTTGRVAELAGVSRGAQIHYFRTRADLVAAAMTHLAHKRAEAVRSRLADGPVGLEAALDILWEQHQGSGFATTLELWVASRTDAELRKRMHEVEREVLVEIAQQAEVALGELARHPEFFDGLVFAMATIRGLALLQVSNGGTNAQLEDLWKRTRARLVLALG